MFYLMTISSLISQRVCKLFIVPLALVCSEKKNGNSLRVYMADSDRFNIIYCKKVISGKSLCLRIGDLQFYIVTCLKFSKYMYIYKLMVIRTCQIYIVLIMLF